MISGYAYRTFRWGVNIIRWLLPKIGVLAQGWQEETAGGWHLADLPATDHFYRCIYTAWNPQVIRDGAGGIFRPGNTAARGQISVIPQRAPGIAGLLSDGTIPTGYR